MISGIHHVTAIASDAQANVNFYAGVLGLRLVKKTINYDDPGTYHLYYGDGQGRPGTILTFFPWPGASRGQVGLGQVVETALTVPADSLPYWRKRLADSGVSVTEGDEMLQFTDNDGMPLALIADGVAGETYSAVPGEAAITGVHHVALATLRPDSTQALLDDVMQLKSGARLDHGTYNRGTMGAGIVHHVAFRVPDDAAQTTWQETLQARGFGVSPVMDRQYFHSIYFREPGGVLFELATDPPGFTADEPLESLGTRLCLPDWLEGNRALIEKSLVPLRLPESV